MFSKSDKEKAAEKVTEAQAKFKLQQVDAGLKLLYEASELDAENADTFFLIGLAEQDMRNHSGAVEGFVKATSLNPDKHEAWGRLAGEYVEGNRFDEAQAAIEQALAFFKKHNQPIPPPYQAVANGVALLKVRHDTENAFQQYPQTAVKFANHPEQDKISARMQELQNNLQKDPNNTLKAMEELLRDYGNVPELFFWHGTVVKNGLPDFAMRDFSRAICLEPQYTAAYIQRTSLWGMIGRFADMLNDMNAVLAYDPNNIEAIAMRADAYNMKGDKVSASKDNEALLNVDLRDHANPTLLLKQGDIFFQHQRLDEALNTYNTFIERPNLPKELLAMGYHNRSKVLNKLNRKDEAVESVSKAVDLMPMMPDYCHGLGEFGKQAGRKADEIRGWEAYIAALKAGARGFLPLYVAENFLREAQARL